MSVTKHAQGGVTKSTHSIPGTHAWTRPGLLCVFGYKSLSLQDKRSQGGLGQKPSTLVPWADVWREGDS